MDHNADAIELKTGKEITLAACGGVWVGEDFYPAGTTPQVGEISPANDGTVCRGMVEESYRLVLERLGR